MCPRGAGAAGMRPRAALAGGSTVTGRAVGYPGGSGWVAGAAGATLSLPPPPFPTSFRLERSWMQRCRRFERSWMKRCRHFERSRMKRCRAPWDSLRRSSAPAVCMAVTPGPTWRGEDGARTRLLASPCARERAIHRSFPRTGEEGARGHPVWYFRGRCRPACVYAAARAFSLVAVYPKAAAIGSDALPTSLVARSHTKVDTG